MPINEDNQQTYTLEEIKKMKELGRIIIDEKGTEKEIPKLFTEPFPDKKVSRVDPAEIEEAVQRIKRIKEQAEVGQTEATWIPQLDYPDKPLLILDLGDPHYTSIRSEHSLLNHYLEVVEDTPNMALVTGGDDTDNFNVTMGSWATGVYENPIEPGIAARGWQQKMEKMDKKGKVGFMVFGNHTGWTYKAGIDWYDTFLGQIEAPILTSGGLVRVVFHGGAKYEIASTHQYWGYSKLNPTNICKRYLEHEYPTADIVLIHHTHQSEVLHFERGGKDRIGIIGGTLKLYDQWARQMGIGGRGGQPGICFSLWPEHREMMAYKNFDRAVEEHLKRL